jgi:chromosome segregation ATPase
MTLPLRIPTMPAGIDELNAKRDALNAKRGELAALLRQDSREAQLREAINCLSDNLRVLREEAAELPELPDEPPERPGLIDDYELVKDELRSLKERITTVREEHSRLTAELAALEGVTICPHCGETGGVERARARLTTRLREAHDSEADAVQKLEEASAPFMDLKTVTAEWQEAMREFDELLEKHAAFQRRIAGAEQSLSETKTELDGLVGNRAAQVEKLTAEVAELPAVEKELAEAQAAKVACDEYKKLVEQRTKREEQALALACEVEVYTQAITALNAHVAKRGEEAFGKVLKLSDAFTKGLLNSPLEFRDGELGRRVSKADREAGLTAPVGAWIPRDSFSGTEELLALTGFGVALARMAPFVLVILDEMGRLTTERRKAVATRMLELLKAGTVHQVIMIDPEPGGVGYPDEAVRVYV